MSIVINVEIVKTQKMYAGKEEKDRCGRGQEVFRGTQHIEHLSLYFILSYNFDPVDSMHWCIHLVLSFMGLGS